MKQVMLEPKDRTRVIKTYKVKKDAYVISLVIDVKCDAVVLTLGEDCYEPTQDELEQGVNISHCTYELLDEKTSGIGTYPASPMDSKTAQTLDMKIFNMFTETNDTSKLEENGYEVTLTEVKIIGQCDITVGEEIIEDATNDEDETE